MQQYIPVALVLFALLMILLRVVRATTDSDGQSSSSLTGIQLTTVVIFSMLFIDTFNDLPMPTPTQGITQAPPTTRKGKTSKKRRKTPTRRKTTSNAAPRSIVKEKYYLLGVMFLSFCALYLLSHRREDMKDWTVKGMLAVRAVDPFEHNIDDALIDVLLQDPYNPEVRQFFLDGLMAKQGKQIGSSTRELEPEEEAEKAPDLEL